MKISEKWLREWVDPRVKAAVLAERLTLAGLEVSGITPATLPLRSVVIGRIESVSIHPQADRLRVCQVNAGKGSHLAIVSGADNASAGLTAPVALPGARLPNGITIEQTNIRGVVSHGMLCSRADLGLEDESTGLWELDRMLKPGLDLVKALDLNDSIFEFELTPNRGDCLSVYGIAREVAALTEARLKSRGEKKTPVKSKKRLAVKLAANGDCARYAGRVIVGLDSMARTPLWMQERLRRSGLRSIHPVVDVTNYVMLELGQPMHAFDFSRLQGPIAVRLARKSEKIALLDGTTPELPKGCMVIADARAAVAVAGIMGGNETAVTNTSTAVFLESAYFRPQAIARCARELGVSSESSYRFERGVDATLQRRALERATQLLLSITGGTAGPVTEQTDRRHLPKIKPISLQPGRVERLLGLSLPQKAISGALKRLGMRVRSSAGALTVVPPAHRFDVVRECDLIEEVARITGYDQIPMSRPPVAIQAAIPSEKDVSKDRVRSVLIGRDYHEVITYSFVDPAVQSLLDPSAPALPLKNPLASDMSVMRTSLWPGLLAALAYNSRRQQTRIRLFEIGPRFIAALSGIREELTVAGLAYGLAMPEQWALPKRLVDFYDVKADIEALLGLVRGQPFEVRSGRHPSLQPGQSAVVVGRGTSGEETTVGAFGTLDPAIQAKFDLPHPVLLFEIALAGLSTTDIPRFQGVSRYPSIRRDLAVVVSRDTPAQTVLDCVRRVAGELLANLEFFDEYHGEGIDSGRKSLGLALTLQDSSRTLKEAAAEAVVERVVAAIRSELGGQIRQ